MEPSVKRFITEQYNDIKNGRVHAGLTVLYVFTGEDQDEAERLVKASPDAFSTAPMAGQVYPMLVTATWSATHVNGRIMPCGNITLAKFEVPFGFEQGNWFFVDTRPA